MRERQERREEARKQAWEREVHRNLTLFLPEQEVVRRLSVYERSLVTAYIQITATDPPNSNPLIGSSPKNPKKPKKPVEY